MRKLLSFAILLLFGVLCSACVNTFAVQQLNQIAAEYLNEGDVQSAISRLESSVDLDGNNYESRYNLATCYLRVGKCDKAVEQIDVANELSKNEPAVHYTVGVAYNCKAQQLYERKTPDGRIEEIEYPRNEQIDVAKKFVDYLKIANDNFEIFIQLEPNAEDTVGARDAIDDNNKKIDAMIAKYNLD